MRLMGLKSHDCGVPLRQPLWIRKQIGPVATADCEWLLPLRRSERDDRVEKARKLQRELNYQLAKLNGLQQSGDLTIDDASGKALATEIRTQAGVCLDLLDRYQLSVPGRMWSYAESRCRPLRDDLRRTEMLFRDASGEFERRVIASPKSYEPCDLGWDDLYRLEEDVEGADPGADDEPEEQRASSPVALSYVYIEAHNRQDLEGLLDLVDDEVEFKRAFDPPLYGKAAVREQYERDWVDHKSEVVTVREMFEAEGKVAIEINVDSGPPSQVLYEGVVVHHWNDEGRLVRYQLYVDEVASAEKTPSV